MSSCDLTVRTGLPSTSLTLLDHTGRAVGEGVGQLDAQGLDPGVYRVQVEAGAETTEKLLVVRPGHTDEHVELELPLVTPVKGAARNHGIHSGVPADLSENPTGSVGAGSRIVLMARVVETPPSGGLPPVDPATLDLLPAEAFGPGLLTLPVWRLGEGYAACSLDVTPSTYVLTSTGSGRTVQQNVQAVPHWTTYVFLPALPGPSEADPWVPLTRGAVVHLAELERRWEPYDFGSDEVFAAEMALEGLRDGELVLPAGGWDALLGDRLRLDPMLGLYAAHAALATPQRPLDAISEVCKALTSLVPEHADVQALRIALRVAGRRWSGPEADPGPPVSLAQPPMLRAAYLALLEADLDDPAVLVDGSPAEQVADRMLADGVWARWDPAEPSYTVDVGMTDLDAASDAVDRLYGGEQATAGAEPPAQLDPPPPPAAPIPAPMPAPSAPPRHPEAFEPADVLPNVDHMTRSAGGILSTLRNIRLPRLRLRRVKPESSPPPTAAKPATPPPAPVPTPVPEPVAPSTREVPRDVARVAEALARLETYRDPRTDPPPTVADVSRVVGLPVARVTSILDGLRRG